MTVLGINTFLDDSSAAIIKSDKIESACQEERFSSILRDSNWPRLSIKEAKKPYYKVDTVAVGHTFDFYKRREIKQFIRKDVGKCSIEFVENHSAHAMSAILTTNWQECAVLVVDCHSDHYATSLGVYKNDKIQWLKRFKTNNSIGHLFSNVTKLCGYSPIKDEHKIMEAATVGYPKWVDWAKESVISLSPGSYKIKPEFLNSFSQGVLDFDIAASAQQVLELTILHLLDWLQKETGQSRLAFSGDIALNSSLNSILARFSSFHEIAIQPASNDAGTALGAAAFVERPVWEHAYLGYEDSNENNPEEIAIRLVNNKIVPLIHGKAEFSRQSLGNRCILSSPTEANINKINNIKNRHADSWMSYAFVCQERHVDSLFDTYSKDNFMCFSADSKGSSHRVSGPVTKLLVVNTSKNAFLNKVLQITSDKGLPVVMMADLCLDDKPLINSVQQFEENLKQRFY